ncbi:MAG: hypothetical protein H6502_01520 [Candidatus Woesearchaeota archaeon]|nr:MAG: hypothetical protein H6502_01520 [Candidatus Woesearchaeota archaeon]
MKGHDCEKTMGIVVLIIGLIYLLGDFNVWNFWGIQWYTVAFLLYGLKKTFGMKKK